MDKIQNSIDLIKQNEPPEGYHLAFSGGKDSICILQLAKMAGVKYKAYFCMTTVDPPDVLWFIKKYYPDVKWLKPSISMFKLIEKKGLPTRRSRYCCEILKEYAGSGEFVILGIRRAESKKRSNRYTSHFSFDERTNKRKLLPILEWTEQDVWTFIKANKLPYPSLYTACQTRIGCIGCPMSTKSQIREFAIYPKFKNAYLIAIRKARARGIMQSWKDEYEAFEWWTSGMSVKNFKASKNQTELF